MRNYFLKRIIVFFKIILTVLVFTQSTFASEPSLEVHLDRDQISMDENLTLTIILKGASAMATPDIPSQGNFDVVGRSMGSSVEMVNGEMSVQKSFEYTLAPRKPGEFTIGPVKLYAEGREYTAGPVRVRVTESQSGNTFQHNPVFPQMPQTNIPMQIPGFPGGPFGSNPPAGPPSEAPGGQETFITVETDKKEVYLGEQILYTFRIYTAVSLQEAQLELPEFKDFISEELVKEKKFQVEMSGRRYAVNEWRLALFPTKTGNLATGEIRVKAKVPVQVNRSQFEDPFFTNFSVSLRPKTFSGANQEIQVRELPPQPADFMGLVGEFSLQASLSKDQLQLGETANLKFEISGKGNIREGTIPAPKFGESFKVYPDKPEVKLEKNLQGLSGKKIFNFALVAEKPGTIALPVINLSYFNPVTQKYESFSTSAMTVHVLGNAVQEQMVTAGLKKNGPEGEKAMTDILPVKAPDHLMTSQGVSVLWNYSLIGLSALGPLLLGGVLLRRRWRLRSEAQAEDRKASRAFKRARSALGQIKGEDPGKLAELSAPIKNYLSDRFRVKGNALTPIEIEELLKGKGVGADSTRRMVYLLEQLDQWRYGGAPQDLPSEKSLKQEILNLLREIEKAS